MHGREDETNTDSNSTFTQKELTKCTVDLLKAVEHDLRSFAKEIRPHVVESIVLTGGSTRLPLFRDKLQRVFPEAVLEETINVEEAASIGAAIIAQRIPPTSDDCGKLMLFKNVDPPTLRENYFSFFCVILAVFSFDIIHHHPQNLLIAKYLCLL